MGFWLIAKVTPCATNTAVIATQNGYIIKSLVEAVTRRFTYMKMALFASFIGFAVVSAQTKTTDPIRTSRCEQMISPVIVPNSINEQQFVYVDFPPLPQGCQYTGSSACGGTGVDLKGNSKTCDKHSRFFTWVCNVFGTQLQNRGCKVSPDCH